MAPSPLRTLLAPAGSALADLQHVNRGRVLALVSALASTRALPEDDALLLPEPILHPLLRPVIADALGLELGQVAGVAAHALALDGAALLDEDRWRAREDERAAAREDEDDDDDIELREFHDFTGALALRRALAEPGRALPTWLSEHIQDDADALWLDRLPIDAPLRDALDGEPLAEAPDAITAELLRLGPTIERLHRLRKLRAPTVIVTSLRRAIQESFDRVCFAALLGQPLRAWTTFDQLVTGSGEFALTPAGPPSPLAALEADVDATTPLAVALAGRARVLVMFAHASVVLDLDGRVLDQFPTAGLRFIAASETGQHLMFVSGGGPCSRTVYFSPSPVVRDADARAWVAGPLPAGVPRQVVGNVADVRWSVVADLERARGCLLLPGCMNDAPDLWTDPGHRVVWIDGERMLLEIASGEPVFDTARLPEDELGEDMDEDELLPPRAFTRARDGRFLFARAGQLLVERPGQTELAAVASYRQGTALSFDADGEFFLLARPDAVEVSRVDADGVTLIHRLELAPLRARLDPAPLRNALRGEGVSPLSADVWRALLGTVGTLDDLATTSPASLARDVTTSLEAMYASETLSEAQAAALIAICEKIAGTDLGRSGTE
ncbi:MAG: hypothetical protein KC468_04020 [Myxococcales bacterium]|nr:hypothetical protein [Myxococcales bacterium]